MAIPFVFKLIDYTESIQPAPTKRGRKPGSTSNPIAHITAQLSFPGTRPQWFDDIVFGSCLNSAGQSGNVCNVCMDEVVGALHLRTFEVQPLLDAGMARRKAQRVIAAARHAAHGLFTYLIRRPELLERCEEEARIEAKLAYSHVALVPYTPLRQVPRHIEELRETGDYLAYGEALREFRLQGTH